MGIYIHAELTEVEARRKRSKLHGRQGKRQQRRERMAFHLGFPTLSSLSRPLLLSLSLLLSHSCSRSNSGHTYTSAKSTAAGRATIAGSVAAAAFTTKFGRYLNEEISRESISLAVRATVRRSQEQHERFRGQQKRKRIIQPASASSCYREAIRAVGRGVCRTLTRAEEGFSSAYTLCRCKSCIVVKIRVIPACFHSLIYQFN